MVVSVRIDCPHVCETTKTLGTRQHPHDSPRRGGWETTHRETSTSERRRGKAIPHGPTHFFRFRTGCVVLEMPIRPRFCSLAAATTDLPDVFCAASPMRCDVQLHCPPMHVGGGICLNETVNARGLGRSGGRQIVIFHFLMLHVLVHIVSGGSFIWTAKTSKRENGSQRWLEKPVEARRSGTRA